MTFSLGTLSWVPFLVETNGGVKWEVRTDRKLPPLNYIGEYDASLSLSLSLSPLSPTHAHNQRLKSTARHTQHTAHSTQHTHVHNRLFPLTTQQTLSLSYVSLALKLPCSSVNASQCEELSQAILSVCLSVCLSV